MSTINDTIINILSNAYPAGVTRQKLNTLCIGLDSRQISNALARLRDTGVIESEEEDGQRVIYLTQAPAGALAQPGQADAPSEAQACSDDSSESSDDSSAIASPGAAEDSSYTEPDSDQPAEPMPFNLEFALADLEQRLKPRQIEDLPTKRAVLTKLAALMDESIAQVLESISADLERAA